MDLKRPDGVPVFNLDVITANMAHRRAKALLLDFKMTPASRTRIIAVRSPDDSGDESKNL
jgi:hypothetical protein